MNSLLFTLWLIGIVLMLFTAGFLIVYSTVYTKKTKLLLYAISLLILTVVAIDNFLVMIGVKGEIIKVGVFRESVINSKEPIIDNTPIVLERKYKTDEEKYYEQKGKL